MMTETNINSRSNRKSGSPQSGGPVFLSIGKLQRTHGVKGELVMDVLTDFPEKIIPGFTVFIGKNHQPYKILSTRPAADKVLVSFEGLVDCDQASILRNQYVYIKTEDANQLPEGQYYHHEIIGMNVTEENGNLVGVVKEILETGANDVYIIEGVDGKEVLIPAIRSAVLSIDRQDRKMVVRIPEWD